MKKLKLGLIGIGVEKSRAPDLQIEILNTKAEALEKAKTASVEQADNGIERVFEMTQYDINFLPGENDGYIF